MAYTILYNTMSIKLKNNKFIPMILTGYSNEYFENTNERFRQWQSATNTTNGQIVYSSKEYRKFKGMQEFLEYAYKNAKDDTSNEYLHSVGIWVKDCDGNMYQVNVIDGTGIGVNGCFFYWSDLLSDYMFLDGRRCGVYE